MVSYPGENGSSKFRDVLVVLRENREGQLILVRFPLRGSMTFVSCTSPYAVVLANRAIYLNNIDSLIATARSNKVLTTLGIQDFSQLKKDYAKDQVNVIMGITGNVISGQVTAETVR